MGRYNLIFDIECSGNNLNFNIQVVCVCVFACDQIFYLKIAILQLTISTITPENLISNEGEHNIIFDFQWESGITSFLVSKLEGGGRS